MTKFIFYKLENKQSVKICYFPKFTTGKRLDYDATSFKAQSLLFFQIFQRLAQQYEVGLTGSQDHLYLYMNEKLNILDFTLIYK